jgi:L-alanine-DL-glutamate epimerase-like enolase superfamily enzyme
VVESRNERLAIPLDDCEPGVDIVQPTFTTTVDAVLRVARMAQVAKMPTTVHISGGFGFVYMLHFASCVPDIGRYQEYKLGTEKFGSWFYPPISVKDGKMTVPSGPGVGIKDVAGLLSGAKEVAPSDETIQLASRLATLRQPVFREAES